MKEQSVWLLGGGPGSDKRQVVAILARALAETGVAKPAVAYLGSASDDDKWFLDRMASLLRAAGSGKVTLAPTCGRGVSSKQARDVLTGADAIFVSGGDVEAGMDVLNRHKLVSFLGGLHKAGKVFIGLSAGSIMLCKAWVRWPDEEDDDSAELFDCLGLAPIYCDTHAEEEDWEELKALLRLLPDGAAGYGIPTSGAIGVTAGAEVHAFGDSVLLVERSGRKDFRSDRLLPDPT